VAARLADTQSLWHALQRLAGVRRMHKAFSQGSIEFLPRENPAVFALTRRCADELLVALLNLSDSPQPVTVDLAQLPGLEPGWHGQAARAVLAPGLALAEPLEPPYALELPPYGYAWLLVAPPSAQGP
jgi:glycosidase